MAVCTKCNEDKPRDQFYKDSSKVTGHTSRCRDCRIPAPKHALDNIDTVNLTADCQFCGTGVPIRTGRSQSDTDMRQYGEWRCDASFRQMRRFTPEEAKERNYWSAVKSKYGISESEYKELMRVQNNSCGICGAVPETVRLDIDHDHSCCPGNKKSCGKCVRGLLCRACNQAIGLLLDDTALLQAAINYLERTRHDQRNSSNVVQADVIRSNSDVAH